MINHGRSSSRSDKIPGMRLDQARLWSMDSYSSMCIESAPPQPGFSEQFVTQA